MKEPAASHRLIGLESDNLLAFLALLGLLRSLEAIPEGRRLCPRACWELDDPPLRPVLCLNTPTTREEVTEIAARGVTALAVDHKFGGPDFNDPKDYPQSVARSMLEDAVHNATASSRGRVDLLASLMCDAAVKSEKEKDSGTIVPTPLCLLFGQGRQHFFERLAKVPASPAPSKHSKSRTVASNSGTKCFVESLFDPWRRMDPLEFSSFRWDLDEARRYALMAGNPSDAAFKGGTQLGANRLATVGLAVLTLVPEARNGQVYPSILGGAFGRNGFSFTWPVWKEPATLSAIRAMLGHPDLRKINGLAHLGVDHVLTARRISVGKFMNFTRAKIQNT